MIGVEAKLSGKVEGDRKSPLARGDQLPEPPVAFGRPGEAGVLPDNPRLL
jgi:hypothetical protein